MSASVWLTARTRTCSMFEYADNVSHTAQFHHGVMHGGNVWLTSQRSGRQPRHVVIRAGMTARHIFGHSSRST
jgi:hypothetical protein